jgi:hypothetical protein
MLSVRGFSPATCLHWGLPCARGFSSRSLFRSYNKISIHTHNFSHFSLPCTHAPHHLVMTNSLGALSRVVLRLLHACACTVHACASTVHACVTTVRPLCVPVRVLCEYCAAPAHLLHTYCTPTVRPLYTYCATTVQYCTTTVRLWHRESRGPSHHENSAWLQQSTDARYMHSFKLSTLCHRACCGTNNTAAGLRRRCSRRPGQARRTPSQPLRSPHATSKACGSSGSSSCGCSGDAQPQRAQCRPGQAMHLAQGTHRPRSGQAEHLRWNKMAM